MSHTEYLDDVELGVLGTQRLKIEFDYSPEERQTYDSPGWPEQWEILEVYIVVDDKEIDVSALKGVEYDAIIDMLREVLE